MKTTIKIKAEKYKDLEVFKSKPEICVYDDKKKELSFEANTFSDKKWRLVYKALNPDGFIALTEGSGITTTIWDVFTGTKEACLRIMEVQGWEDGFN
jgi:hypothetical protein